MHVNVQPNKETAHEIAGENQGVKSLCMLMDEEIKETIKIGNHYMDGLFAWEPGGRKGMCFFHGNLDGFQCLLWLHCMRYCADCSSWVSCLEGGVECYGLYNDS
jgi:hypothetical protein